LRKPKVVLKLMDIKLLLLTKPIQQRLDGVITELNIYARAQECSPKRKRLMPILKEVLRK
jgi:hypothetical protein